MKFTATFLLVALTTSASAQFCLTQWWPRTCATVGSPSCLQWGPTYATLFECDGTTPTPTPEPTPDPSMWCVTGWDPRGCGQVGDGDCLPHTERFETQAECEDIGAWEAPTAEPEPTPDPSMWCVTGWNPRTCGQVGDGDCLPHTERFDDQTECEELRLADPLKYCRTSWWPVRCETEGSGHCIRGYTVRYDTMLECNPNYLAQCPLLARDTGMGCEDFIAFGYEIETGLVEYLFGNEGHYLGVDVFSEPADPSLTFATEWLWMGDDYGMVTFYGQGAYANCADAVDAMGFGISPIAESCVYVRMSSSEEIISIFTGCTTACPDAAGGVKALGFEKRAREFKNVITHKRQ